ncbi:MAG: trans-AT polyketide synthase, acyltransferase and oxidoreductase domain [Bradyrhizobium sp.]|jgi:trans-AT polyketide synthase/acyltransferase/oxidoreductase domain-containing protein|nr:trans-AT polyketide synthase, acyltransferase and oxidoreductase domain [Bradyrhizobium sp.]
MAAEASDILGYSIEELCLKDSESRLGRTQYTQPALYVVNAMGYAQWLEDNPAGTPPAFAAGHSLGEYNALLAAKVFDFQTGLKLVRKRGELMAAAGGGTMAAIIGTPVQTVRELLVKNGLTDIDFANYNTPTQIVIAGSQAAIAKAEQLCAANNIRCLPLNVSAPFHSRHMLPAQKEFSALLETFSFNGPVFPVISNVTAKPYEPGKTAATLGAQIGSSVQWTDSIRYLMGQEVNDYQEIGSSILTKMVNEIRTSSAPILPLTADSPAKVAQDATNGQLIAAATTPITRPALRVDGGETRAGLTSLPRKNTQPLGSPAFCRRYGIKYAYVAGSMYREIASPELVVRMGKAGLIGFYGIDGLSLAEIESGIRRIQSQLTNGEAYGVNLLADYAAPERETRTVELFLKFNIRRIEAAAFIKATPAIVLFRVKGLSKDDLGNIICKNHILAKVSRPEVAEEFMRPAPAAIVEGLLKEGRISAAQAELAKHVPLAHDICVEADCGGRTDGGIPTVLLPTMQRLKNQITAQHSYAEPVCMGLAGGIGTPEAAAAAFLMEADFILTGSINQCTVEARTSDEVKTLLQDLNVQDTDYAPAGDMFELGAKVQVMRKGVFFPARANKLFSIYQHYEALEDIPETLHATIENNYFKKSFADVWNETKSDLERRGKLPEITRAESDRKYKMALIFRWYFFYTAELALTGNTGDRVNFQIHVGPALGAFNQWVKGTALESWKNRHVDEIAEKIMTATADYLQQRCEWLARASVLDAA